jgi:hypothetical protein
MLRVKEQRVVEGSFEEGEKTGTFYVSTSFVSVDLRGSFWSRSWSYRGKERRTTQGVRKFASKAAGESKLEAYPLGYVEDFDERERSRWALNPAAIECLPGVATSAHTSRSDRHPLV